MNILDKFRKKFEKKQSKAVPEKATRVKPDKSDHAAQEKKPVKSESGEVKKTSRKGGSAESIKAEVKDKSGSASQVILRPLQTEKITDQMMWGQYTFEVSKDSNKSEIKKAIKAIYDVEPVRINVINMRGKAVRFGRTWSKRKNWKKAIITLKPGDKIEVYEGV
jgi:large subunit ribosomal protein L23